MAWSDLKGDSQQFLQVNDCIGLLEKSRPGAGTISRILTRDGFSPSTLVQRGIRTVGAQKARIYTTAKGYKFVVKPPFLEELAAYIADRRLKLFRVPQTELVQSEGELFSVQKFVTSPKVKFINIYGKVAEVNNISVVAENSIPEDLVLFDAVIGNSDRELTGGKNYLILTDDELPTQIDLRVSLPNIRNPRFVAYDHGLAFRNLNTEKWRKEYGIDWNIFVNMVKRNPVFIENLRQWEPEQIRRDLGTLIKPENFQSLLDRREFIIGIFDRP